LYVFPSLILDNSVTANHCLPIVHDAHELAERSFADGKSLLGGLLLGQSNLLLVGSNNWTALLNNVELHMAVGGEIWGDSTVSSIGSSSSLDGSLGSNVGNLALLDVETFALGIGLEVLEELNNMFDRFLWESTVVMAEVLAHGMSSWSTSVSSEWDDSGVLKDSLHVLNSLQEVEASAGSGSLIGVLVVSSQIVNSACSSYTKYKISIRKSK
jgi:hypothetical protein